MIVPKTERIKQIRCYKHENTVNYQSLYLSLNIGFALVHKQCLCSGAYYNFTLSFGEILRKRSEKAALTKQSVSLGPVQPPAHSVLQQCCGLEPKQRP